MKIGFIVCLGHAPPRFIHEKVSKTVRMTIIVTTRRAVTAGASVARCMKSTTF